MEAARRGKETLLHFGSSLGLCRLVSYISITERRFHLTLQVCSLLHWAAEYPGGRLGKEGDAMARDREGCTPLVNLKFTTNKKSLILAQLLFPADACLCLWQGRASDHPLPLELHRLARDQQRWQDVRGVGRRVQLPKPQGRTGGAGQAEEEGGAGDDNAKCQTQGFPQAKATHGGRTHKGASYERGSSPQHKSEEANTSVNSVPSQPSFLLLLLLLGCQEFEDGTLEATFGGLRDQLGVPQQREHGLALTTCSHSAERMSPALQVRLRDY